MAVLWTEIGYPSHLEAKVRDLWKSQDLGVSTAGYAADVPSHGAVMLKVMPQ